MTPTDVLAQLSAPDQLGVTLALFRMRAYRFSDDLRLYVLAEWLEERFIQGHRLRPATLAYVEESLEQIRTTGRPLPFLRRVADAEELDLDAELEQRHRHTAAASEKDGEPDQIVFIVGAPRSGTSHLYNLLAHTGRFAYFTTVSCWAWPTRNLDQPERCLIEPFDRRLFDIDNKTTRIVPALAAPHEAEDLYARAIPTYRHLHGHAYQLEAARPRNPDLLRRAVRAHVTHFDRRVMLSKSPFNSLRIAALDEIWGRKARYLHIVRSQHDVANSMRRNGFRFATADRWLTEEDACTAFNAAVREQAHRDRLHTVTLDELQADPESVVAEVLAWLGGTALFEVDHGAKSEGQR